MNAPAARFRAFLAPPQFPDLEKDRQAALINLIIVAMVCCMIVALATLPWITERESRLQFFFGMAVMFATAVVARRLLFDGRVTLAGRLLFGVLWLVLLALALRGSGLTSMAYLTTLALTPLLAGVMIGGGAGFIVTIVNLLLGAAFMVAELNGTLPIGTVYDPPARFISYVALFGALPLLAHTWRRSFLENVDRHRQQIVAEREAALLRDNKLTLEQAVRSATSDLADALGREQSLSQSLEEALQRERQYGAVKTAIIRNLSHEFRTPLTVINTNVDLLWRYSDRLSEAKKEQYQGSIKASVQYLTGLLDDISAVSRVGETPAPPALEAISLAALARQLRADVHYMVSPAGSDVFHCPESDEVLQLPVAAVRAIVRQLVGNALKFGRDQTRIRVTVRLEDEALEIAVHDDGIGIPAGETKQIFDLFVRGSNVGAHRGLGLGLYLAQVNAQQIHARLTAASAGPDQGATFTATIPLTPPDEATMPGVP